MSTNDSIKKTLIVAFSLCIVCSVIVSTAAVMLKPAQQANQSLDRKRNILAAAGMLDENISIDEQFAKMTPRVVDLRTGKFSDAVDAEGYNERKAAKDPAQSDALSSSEDIAKVFRREHYAVVYVANDTQGGVDKIILPIRGYGLWGTLYGFIALEGDADRRWPGWVSMSIGETPGLGGEVDNPQLEGAVARQSRSTATVSVAIGRGQGRGGPFGPCERCPARWTAWLGPRLTSAGRL